MMSMASRRAKLRAEMSGKLQDAYDRICLDVPDADPEAARTAAEIIVKIDELKAEKAARESERKALSSRRRRAKMDYIKNHDEIGAEIA